MWWRWRLLRCFEVLCVNKKTSANTEITLNPHSLHNKQTPPAHTKTQRLKAGETWYGDYVIRSQQRYWQLPMWDRRALQPMPAMVPALDEGEEEGEEDGDGDGEEGGGGEDDFDGGDGAPLSG